MKRFAYRISTVNNLNVAAGTITALSMDEAARKVYNKNPDLNVHKGEYFFRVCDGKRFQEADFLFKGKRAYLSVYAEPVDFDPKEEPEND